MTFTIPNLLSLLRMGLIPLFVIMVMNGDAPKALLIFVVAGVTDALDGFIARFWKQQSLLGAYLDPMADKLLLTTAYVVLSIPSLNHGGTQIPPWVTILVIARDVLIVAVALVLYLAAGVRKFPPSVLSKINTILQVVAVALVLVSGAFPKLRSVELAADATLYLVAGLTVASGLYYIYLYTYRSISGGQEKSQKGQQGPQRQQGQ
jgi:cardiolipin synthase